MNDQGPCPKAFKTIKVQRRIKNDLTKYKHRFRNLHGQYSNRNEKKIVFTYEKDLTLKIVWSRQNDRVFGITRLLVLHFIINPIAAQNRSRFPLMSLGTAKHTSTF